MSGSGGRCAVFFCDCSAAGVVLVILVDTTDIDDTHEELGKTNIVHLDFDVFFKGVLSGDAARLTEDKIEKGLQFGYVDVAEGFLKL